MYDEVEHQRLKQEKTMSLVEPDEEFEELDNTIEEICK